ncbi:MAG: thioredoxin family protein [Byssovorax sp.]
MLPDPASAGLVRRGPPALAAFFLAVGALIAGALAAGCQREPSPPPGGAPVTLEPPRPPSASPPPSAAPPASSPAAPAPAPLPSAVAPADPAPVRPFTLVELAPTQGDLTPLVAEQVERAQALGRRPFVEFYADWCGPCQTLHRSMDDPRMIDAFRGTWIVRLNVDDWKDKLPGTGFVPREIPVYYAVNAEGRPTGRSLLGTAWARAAPEGMAPRLKAFFQR